MAPFCNDGVHFLTTKAFIIQTSGAIQAYELASMRDNRLNSRQWLGIGRGLNPPYGAAAELSTEFTQL
jgi:hypothetical protein